MPFGSFGHSRVSVMQATDLGQIHDLPARRWFDFSWGYFRYDLLLSSDEILAVNAMWQATNAPSNAANSRIIPILNARLHKRTSVANLVTGS